MHTTQATARETHVAGVFHGMPEARRAVEALRLAGYQDDQIGIIDRPQADISTGLPGDPTHTRWEEGAVIGASLGAVVGVGLGLAVASGLIAPLGPPIAGGMLVGLVAATAAGAVIGMVIGALCGLGIPEEDAHLEVGTNRVVVAVHVSKENATAAADLLRSHGGRIRPMGDAGELGVYGNALAATPF